MSHKFLSLLLGLSLLVPACRSQQPSVIIGAASNFFRPLTELESRIERDTGLAVDLTFNASGVLTRQIQQAARIDLFLSAAPDYIDKLVTGGFIHPNDRCPLVRGRLVILFRPGTRLTHVEDLTRRRVRHIAIANPAYAPYGQAAVEVLRKRGLYEEVQPKLIMAGSVRQTALFVRQGQVDAAFTAAALVTSQEHVIRVPLKDYPPILHELALTRWGARRPEARRLYQYLCSDVFRSRLIPYGYAPLPSMTR